MYRVSMVLFVVVMLMMMPKCEARDRFTVEFQPLRKETLIAEITWQALNVVDALQTVQIAKNPACYQEVGTINQVFGINHPSVGQAIGFFALFGVLHYGTAKVLEAVADKHPSFYNVQRVFEYGGLIYKANVVKNNADYGLGLNHSRSCVE
jgi:hypothetical protein